MKENFETMTDTRQQAKVQHNFTEIVMMVICAVIAGCDVWEDIADYDDAYLQKVIEKLVHA